MLAQLLQKNPKLKVYIFASLRVLIPAPCLMQFPGPPTKVSLMAVLQPHDQHRSQSAGDLRNQERPRVACRTQHPPAPRRGRRGHRAMFWEHHKDAGQLLSRSLSTAVPSASLPPPPFSPSSHEPEPAERDARIPQLTRPSLA